MRAASLSWFSSFAASAKDDGASRILSSIKALAVFLSRPMVKANSKSDRPLYRVPPSL